MWYEISREGFRDIEQKSVVQQGSNLRRIGRLFPTISGGFPAIFLPLLRVSLSLLSVVFVSSVTMPPFALPSQRNVDAYVHCSVTWGKEKRKTNSDTFFSGHQLSHKLEKDESIF